MPDVVLAAYGMDMEETKVVPFGTGLINTTWKVDFGGQPYILQKINDSVFKNPEGIAFNISEISGYLRGFHPDYFFVSPVKTTDGRAMVFAEGKGYYRMFPFVAGSHTVDVAETPEQAYEAASQFGEFTRRLEGFDASVLHYSIPDFHNITKRYLQFEDALKNGNPERRSASVSLISFLTENKAIADTYEQIKSNPQFLKRVTHHDTKISNVLFDQRDKGICVIDLDTVMPGYFISDVGDMMRSYLSPVGEESDDFDGIEIREDYYRAIVQGYSNQMKDSLTDTEQDYFLYAGKFLIYMQALRYMTDYLNMDIYYGAKFPEQNFFRTKNQVVLLQRLLEKENLLIKIK